MVNSPKFIVIIVSSDFDISSTLQIGTKPKIADNHIIQNQIPYLFCTICVLPKVLIAI